MEANQTYYLVFTSRTPQVCWQQHGNIYKSGSSYVTRNFTLEATLDFAFRFWSWVVN